jgi:hypothetical protein
MSASNVTNNSSSTTQPGNPLFSTFTDEKLQPLPYWVQILELLLWELLVRCWNKKYYGSFSLASESVDVNIPDKTPRPPRPVISNPSIITRRTNGWSFTVSTIYIVQCLKELKGNVVLDVFKIGAGQKKHPQFDSSDLIFNILPLLGHTIWYCQIQSSCMSSANSTLWNCYNAFGYRLYNYIFASYISFIYEFIAKVIIELQKREKIKNKERPEENRKPSEMITFYTSIVCSIITIIFVGGAILPYLFTNIFPMMCAYIFIIVIYIYVVLVVAIVLHYYTLIFPPKDATKSINSWSELNAFLNRYKVVRSTAMHLFNFIIPVLFNLSQYLYYGESYLQSMTDEYNSRSSKIYFDSFKGINIVKQVFHTVLPGL